MAKWILKALQGDEPWTILIRYNISKFVPRRNSTWKGLSLNDIIAGQFEVKPANFSVFKSIWKD